MEVNQGKAKKVEPEIKLEKLRLLCRKCNKEWIEERPMGYLVRYEKNNNYLINRNDPEEKKYFRCPNCKSRRKISRLAVKPVLKIKLEK